MLARWKATVSTAPWPANASMRMMPVVKDHTNQAYGKRAPAFP
jgi:hypothetical protein